MSRVFATAAAIATLLSVAAHAQDTQRMSVKPNWISLSTVSIKDR